MLFERWNLEVVFPFSSIVCAFSEVDERNYLYDHMSHKETGLHLITDVKAQINSPSKLGFHKKG